MSVGSKLSANGGQSGLKQATTIFNRVGPGVHFRMRPNYAQNVVTCGDFSCSTGWTLGPGWTIGSGVMAFDGTHTASASTQDVLVIGQRYTARMDVLTCTQGKVRIGDGTTNAERNSPGELSVDFTAAATKLAIEADQDAAANFIGSVDNVICRRRAV